MAAAATASTDTRSFHRLLLVFSLAVSVIFAWRYGMMIENGAADAIFAHDFAVFYRAVQHLAWPPQSPYYIETGETLLRHIAINQYHPYLNPPFLLFFLWPLKFLSYPAAMACFLGGQLALWIAVLHAPAVKNLWPQLARQQYYTAATLLLSLPFAVNTVMVGQMGIFYAAIMLLGTALLHSRPRIAGITLGLMACKPTLAIMLPILLVGGRHWRALMYFALTIVLLAALATAAWGVSIWADWIQASRIHTEMMRQPQLPEKFRLQLVSLYAGLRMAGLGVTPAWLAQAAATVISALTVFVAAWRRRHYPALLALVYVSTFLAGGYVLQYDTVILSAAMLLLLDAGHRRALTPLARIALIFGACSGVVTMQLQMFSIPLGATVILLLWWSSVQIVKPLYSGL